MGKGWQAFNLEDLIEIKHGYAFSSEYFSDKETDKILLTPGNFHVNGHLYFGNNTKYYFGETSADFYLQNGDLLIVMTDLTKDMNILGNTVMLKSDKIVLHNQRIGKIVIKDDKKLDKEFLCYLLNSNLCKKYIKKTATGSTVRHTSNKAIFEIMISMPSFEEQRKIAEILGTWDSAIALTEKLIATKRKRKKALMQKLINSAYYLPETIHTKLCGVALVKTGPFGSLLHESDYQDFGIPIITVEHLSENGILHKNLPLVSEEDKNRLSTYILREGDIVFSRVGSVDRSSVVTKLENGWLFSGRLLRVRPDKKRVCYQFLNYFFHQEVFKHKIRSLAVGGTMPCLNTQILESVPISLPPLEEQQKIAKLLTICDEEIIKTQKQAAFYHTQKRGLMQKLLTGEWRVKIEKAGQQLAETKT